MFIPHIIKDTSDNGNYHSIDVFTGQSKDNALAADKPTSKSFSLSTLQTHSVDNL